ncbi:MAG: 23S rRNA (uracil(1939)-C(5))-methyltransferase RlmD [Chloroflexi bacterium]|nr:23S rRNA (uracil(1939)-C(5))-methyltransferase RlmD [Chloroflexota bacterium]
MTNTAAAQSPPLERGDVIQLDLLAWGRLGEAMATWNGRDVFVFGGIPGETVQAEVVALRRKYVAAQVVGVINPSDRRVEPPCDYFGQCTGCQWQHLTYDAQLAAKTAIVKDRLQRIGAFHNATVLDTIPSPNPYRYRNHARFNIWRETGTLGFTHRERRRFVRIDHCLLMNDRTNELLSQLQDRCAETTALSIRASDATGDYLVQPTLKNPDVPIPTGQKRYLESVAGHEFQVASPSFFQVNVAQAARLAELAKDALQLTGSEIVLDAYTGVGTFAVLLAPHAGRIIAVEESTAAIADAQENAAGLPNVEFVAGKVEDVLPNLEAAPDAVILDPSRSGCQSAALDTLLRLAPQRIAYVSCNPETLARDLAILCRRYRVESVQPVDMFPQTHHVECVATLTLKPADAEVVLASASPRRRTLLGDLGIDFRVAPSNIPEDPEPDETPERMVRRLSREKALAVAQAENAAAGYYVAADSTVVLDGEAIAKPADASEARAMLTRLRGQPHHVVTGLTVYDAATGRCITDAQSADVLMRDFTDAEMERSIASGAPMDKAGAYAIQDTDFHPASLQSGCYSNVMGLPACRVVEMLAELGCQLPDYAAMTVPPGCTLPCLLNRPPEPVPENDTL